MSSDVNRSHGAGAVIAVFGRYFVLYSLALQRGSVTVATAPMIVMQTLTPAALGVLALGDAVRESWLPAAVLGLLVTGAGAVVLGRFDDVREPPETAAVKRDGGV